MKLSDARIVLTGATGGIGQATARELLRAGATLLLVARSDAALESFTRDLHGEGVAASRLNWLSADITRASDRDRLAVDARRLGCNVVIHNAGQPSFGRLQDQDPVGIESVLQTNLMAPMLLTQALLPHFQALPQARIVFVGSVLGSIGLPGYSVYGASKFGIHGFAQALRRELQGSGIGVQYIGPRTTDTGFNNAAVQAYNRSTGTAQDSPALVARAIARLIHDGAPERLLGYPEKLAARLNGVAPGLLDGGFRRHRDALLEQLPAMSAARS